MTDEFSVDIAVIRKKTKHFTFLKNRRIQFSQNALLICSSKENEEKIIYPCERFVYKTLKEKEKRLRIDLVDNPSEEIALNLIFKPHDASFIVWVVKNFNKMIEANKQCMQLKQNKKKATSPKRNERKPTFPELVKRASQQEPFEIKPLYMLGQRSKSKTSRPPTPEQISSQAQCCSQPIAQEALQNGTYKVNQTVTPRLTIVEKNLNAIPCPTSKTGKEAPPDIVLSKKCTTPVPTPSQIEEQIADNSLAPPNTTSVSSEAVTRAQTTPCRNEEQKAENNLKPEHRHRSLINTGNSCYFNSTMQALVGCPPFILRCNHLQRLSIKFGTLFKNERERSPESSRKYEVLLRLLTMTAALSRCYGNAQPSPNCATYTKLNLRAARLCIAKINNMFDNDDQQDAHEYLITLLGAVNDIATSSDFALSELNPVNVFKYVVETKYICQGCDSVEIRTDCRIDLGLFVKNKSSVQELLTQFGEWHPVEKECMKCHHKVASTSDRISRFPQSLIVNLKRYRIEDAPNRSVTTRKIHCSITPTYMLDASIVGSFTPVEHHDLETKTKNRILAREENGNGGSMKGGASRHADWETTVEKVIMKEMHFSPLNDFDVLADILAELKLGYIANTIRKEFEMRQLGESRIMSRVDPPELTIRIEGDGNCFYRAISWWLTGNQTFCTNLRSETAEYLFDHKDIFKKYCDRDNYKEYVNNVREDGEWASQCEIFAMASMLNVEIYTFLNNAWTCYRPQTHSTPRKGAIYLRNASNHFEPVLSLRNPTIKTTEYPEIAEKSQSTERKESKISYIEVDNDDDDMPIRNNEKKRIKHGEANHIDEIEKNKKMKKIEDQLDAINGSSPSPCGSMQYSLTAVVCHIGESPHSGHYETYVKDLYKENEWLLCNDEKILLVLENEVSHAICSSGYILFYDLQSDMY